MRHILKPEVEIDFLVNFIFELQEGDELVALRLSLHSEHDIISSVIGQFVEDRMVREVYVLRSNFSAIVRADFYLSDEGFKQSHELVDVIVAITLRVGYHVADKCCRFHSFFFFIKVLFVLISVSDLVFPLFVELDLFDDVEHLKDVE